MGWGEQQIGLGVTRAPCPRSIRSAPGGDINRLTPPGLRVIYAATADGIEVVCATEREVSVVHERLTARL